MANEMRDPITEAMAAAFAAFGAAMRTYAYAKEKKYGHAAGMASAGAASGVMFFGTLWNAFSKTPKPAIPTASSKLSSNNSIYGKWINSQSNAIEWIIGNDSEMHFFVTNSKGSYNVYTGTSRNYDGRPFFSVIGTNTVGDYIMTRGQLTSDSKFIETISDIIAVQNNQIISTSREHNYFIRC